MVSNQTSTPEDADLGEESQAGRLDGTSAADRTARRLFGEAQISHSAAKLRDRDGDRNRHRAWEDWIKSTDRRKALRSVAMAAAVPAAFGLAFAVMDFVAHVPTFDRYSTKVPAAGGAILCFLILYFSMPLMVMKRSRFIRSRIFELEEAQPDGKLQVLADEIAASAARALPSTEPEHTDLRTAVLWADTVERLDRYHRLVTSQADTSYLMAQIAAAAGFVVLLSAVVVAAFANTEIASGVAGGLGALGAAIAAYIGKTFQRSYEQATTRLLAYFQQPLALSRILMSERLLDHLSAAAKDQAVLSMIQAAISGSNGDPPEMQSR